MMATTTKLNARKWNTYKQTAYTHQVGDDQRATGGTHRHEIKKYAGGWWKRIVDSNGRFESPGPAEQVSDEEGKRLFAMAETY